MTSGVWAAVPVKEFAGAKQRLVGLLTSQQRQALAAAMLEDVLAALADAPLAGIMVNTLDPTATELARRYGARVVTENARDGHTGAVAAMARILTAEGREAMLTVPGDLPRVTAGEIAAVVAARRPAPSVTIVPAHDERGSNAVLVLAASGNAAALRRRQLSAASGSGARSGYRAVDREASWRRAGYRPAAGHTGVAPR